MLTDVRRSRDLEGWLRGFVATSGPATGSTLNT